MQVAQTRRNTLAALTISGVLIFASGCAKKVTPSPVATAPQAKPAAPSITFSASPQNVQKGQAAELTWQTNNATSVELQGIGSVSTSGSRQVTPDSSTTYTLVATGPGGTTQSTARINVSVPVAAATPQPDVRSLFTQNVKDVFFAYDQSSMDTEGQQLVTSDAAFLEKHPELKFTIEGHCDERGSEEYNLVLGANRAETVKKALIAQGVDANRIKTISYGKERPFCTESNEECWHLNRRGHYVLPE